MEDVIVGFVWGVCFALIVYFIIDNIKKYKIIKGLYDDKEFIDSINNELDAHNIELKLNYMNRKEEDKK